MLLSEGKNFLGDLPTWVTAIATLLLGALALFQDSLRRWLTKPVLELELHPSPPDFHKTEWKQQILRHVYDSRTHQHTERVVQEVFPCYYFRLRVVNVGNCEAREVEIFAKDLKQVVDGQLTDVHRFSPMDLLWSDIRVPFLSILSPKVPRFCDLMHVVRPAERDYLDHHLPDVGASQTILAFDLQVEPNSRGHLIASGHYRLTMILAAANATPREYHLDIIHAGVWHDDQERMLSDGVRFHLHKV